MTELFKQSLQDAKKGKQIIESYYEKHIEDRNKRTVVLIFPDDDSQLLSAVFQYLDEFFNKFHYDVAVILSSIDFDKYKFQLNISKQVNIYNVSKSDMEDIMRFYSFTQERCPNIKLFSLHLPFNQKSCGLIGFKDITIEKYVYHYLFRILGQV